MNEQTHSRTPDESQMVVGRVEALLRSIAVTVVSMQQDEHLLALLARDSEAVTALREIDADLDALCEEL